MNRLFCLCTKRATSFELRATSYELRAASFELRVSSCELRATSISRKKCYYKLIKIKRS